MKQLTFIGILLFVGSSIFFVVSCGSGEKKTGVDSLAKQMDGFGDPTNENGVYYQIPSPEELFSIIRDCKLTYQQTLLNSISNAPKYTNIKAKELNFGVYVADLAYAAAFQRFQESLKNIESVRKMSEDIGISAVFDEALNKRFKAMTENPDSLLSITNSSYYKIIEYLDQNSMGRTLALTSTGGWVESMYIITNLVDKYSSNPKAIQRIADQKLTFDNLVNYLDKQKADESVKSILETIKPIGEVYATLKNVPITVKQPKTTNKKIISVGDASRIELTEAQFMQLKQKIKDVRNQITGN